MPKPSVLSLVVIQKHYFVKINDTLREKMCFTQFSTRMPALLFLTFFICSHNQLSSIHSIVTRIKEYRCLKSVIDQIDSKNEWLLLHCKAIFLTGFILKPTERAYILLKSGTRDFQNNLPFERSVCFNVTISGNLECFQYFEFETYFLESGNIFQKTGVPFFS